MKNAINWIFGIGLLIAGLIQFSLSGKVLFLVACLVWIALCYFLKPYEDRWVAKQVEKLKQQAR